MDRRGLAMKVVASDSGINPATLATYFPADPNADPAQIPGGAIHDLCGVLPADLLSLLLPDGFCIVRAPGAVDHDELATAVTDYLGAKQAAHHPESECGPAIGPRERAGLDSKVVQLPIAKAAA
jgi:hypothetical protein